MIKVANWAESLVPSAIQRSVSFSTRPEFTSFALGLPATELLPSSLLLQGIDDKLLDNDEFVIVVVVVLLVSLLTELPFLSSIIIKGESSVIAI